MTLTSDHGGGTQTVVKGDICSVNSCMTQGDRQDEEEGLCAVMWFVYGLKEPHRESLF